jgi:hypothetical protein
MSEVVSLDQYQPRPDTGERPGVQSAVNRPAAPRDVFFDRREFSEILNLYGHMVAQGEWRDYALLHDREQCAFAVFRRSAEGALYRIVKTPALARRQGAYAVLSAGGRVLKRGHTLQAVLKLFARKRFVVV